MYAHLVVVGAALFDNLIIYLCVCCANYQFNNIPRDVFMSFEKVGKP